MDLFSKLEKLSEKFIEGMFKTKAPGSLQPVEIATALYQEMKDKKHISLTRVYVPNEYKVMVSSADWSELGPLGPSLAEELSDYIVKKAGEKEYYLAGRPVINFDEDEGLNQGEFRVEGHFVGIELPKLESEKETVPQENPAPEVMERTQVFKGISQGISQERTPRAELLVLEGSDPGMVFRLQQHRMVIGRRSTNEIYLDDPKISRQHAEVTFENGEYCINDLGSLNGTLVNDGKISKKKLEPGDRIVLGSTLIQFRVV